MVLLEDENIYGSGVSGNDGDDSGDSDDSCIMVVCSK